MLKCMLCGKNDKFIMPVILSNIGHIDAPICANCAGTIMRLSLATAERPYRDVFKTGAKTFYHKWYHELGYLACLIWGHTTYGGYSNELGINFDHCRRCERYNDDRKLPSLHLWHHWIMLRVKWAIYWQKRGK